MPEKKHGYATRHGRSPTWRTWKYMRARCLSKTNKNYHDYGGAGIGMCERWAGSFLNFLADMGERPPGMSIDRIDNSKGYSPENCRWARPLEQSWNSRRTKLITHEGETLSGRGWARKLGMQQTTFAKRIRSGEPIASIVAGAKNATKEAKP